MATTLESTETPIARLESMSTRSKARFAAFTLVVLLGLALAGLMLRAELVMAATGWTQDLGIHQLHDQLIFAFLWLALVVPLALLLYHPTDRVNTVLVPALFSVPVAVMAYLADSPIVMLGAIFGVVGLIALALHPAGRSVFTFDRVETLDRRLLGLYAVGAVAFVIYGVVELAKQFGTADDHTLFVHFGAMAIAATYVVVMGALAITRERDWEFAAWSAGLVAIVIGAASILFAVESSVGPVWGALAVLFGVGFIAAVEYVRRTDAATEPAESVSA